MHWPDSRSVGSSEDLDIHILKADGTRLRGKVCLSHTQDSLFQHRPIRLYSVLRESEMGAAVVEERMARATRYLTYIIKRR